MSDTVQRQYRVRYQFGTYSGSRTVWAEDRDEAIRIVKRELAPHMTLAMAHEAYRAEEVVQRREIGTDGWGYPIYADDDSE